MGPELAAVTLTARNCKISLELPPQVFPLLRFAFSISLCVSGVSGLIHLRFSHLQNGFCNILPKGLETSLLSVLSGVEIGPLSAGLLVPWESLAIYSRPALVGTWGQKLRDPGPGQRAPLALQAADRAHTRPPLRPAPAKAPGPATSRSVVPPSGRDVCSCVHL